MKKLILVLSSLTILLSICVVVIFFKYYEQQNDFELQSKFQNKKIVINDMNIKTQFSKDVVFSFVLRGLEDDDKLTPKIKNLVYYIVKPYKSIDLIGVQNQSLLKKEILKEVNLYLDLLKNKESINDVLITKLIVKNSNYMIGNSSNNNDFELVSFKID